MTVSIMCSPKIVLRSPTRFPRDWSITSRGRTKTGVQSTSRSCRIVQLRFSSSSFACTPFYRKGELIYLKVGKLCHVLKIFKEFLWMEMVHWINQHQSINLFTGWSKWYEFSDVDFSTCVKLLEDIWQTNSIQVPWNIIKGICGSAVYGGRIENIDDFSVLESYLQQYCNDEVLSHRWRPFGTKNSLPSSSDFNVSNFFGIFILMENGTLINYTLTLPIH